MSEMHRFLNTEDLVRYILGGNAKITIVSVETGVRNTYLVRSSKRSRQNMRYVRALDENYAKYIGHIEVSPDVTRKFQRGWRSELPWGHMKVKAFLWLWNYVVTGHRDHLLKSKVEVWHHGRCGKCGRSLTVPESITKGLGPKCAQEVQHGKY